MSNREQTAQFAKDLAKLGVTVPSRYPSKAIVNLVHDYTEAVREAQFGSDMDASIERCRYRDLMEALADMESAS